MIKTLLWDIDGTLLDFSKAEEYGIRKCFEIFSLGECTDEMLSRYSKINRKYWERLERNEITKQQVLTERFVEFFKLENIDFNDIDKFCRILGIFGITGFLQAPCPAFIVVFFQFEEKIVSAARKQEP